MIRKSTSGRSLRATTYYFFVIAGGLVLPGNCLAQAAVFMGCGFFDTPGIAPKVIASMKDGGFDTILLETHIAPDGRIRANRTDLLNKGEWIAGEGKRRHVIDLVATVDRVEFWFAGWSRRDYDAIRKIKADKQATANLRANLAAVKALGVIGYTDDDEDVYDAELGVWMNQQIKASGLKNSITPYKRPDYWLPIIKRVGVDRIYYQSYFPRRKLAGWDKLDGELYVGLNSSKDDLESARNKFAAWGKNPKVVGGFVWSWQILNKKRDADFAGYSRAIRDGVSANATRLSSDDHPAVYRQPSPVR
ncbi:MAG: hypothetical protein AAGB00_00690 [Planctomycetota bacterium]